MTTAPDYDSALMKIAGFVVICCMWSVIYPVSFAQKADQTVTDAKLRQADSLQDKGALQESRAIYESVVKALGASESSSQVAHALNGLSNVASSQGNYDDGVELARQAEAIYRKLGDAQGQAYALNSEGIAEGELGRYSKAQESFRKALAFSQSNDDRLTSVQTACRRASGEEAPNGVPDGKPSRLFALPDEEPL